MTTGLIVLGIAYGTITVATMVINMSEWFGQNEYVVVEPKRWDDRKRAYTEPVKARNPARRYHARLVVLAPLWPVLILVIAGRLIGDIVIDAFRRED